MSSNLLYADIFSLTMTYCQVCWSTALGIIPLLKHRTHRRATLTWYVCTHRQNVGGGGVGVGWGVPFGAGDLCDSRGTLWVTSDVVRFEVCLPVGGVREFWLCGWKRRAVLHLNTHAQDTNVYVHTQFICLPQNIASKLYLSPSFTVCLSLFNRVHVCMHVHVYECACVSLGCIRYPITPPPAPQPR